MPTESQKENAYLALPYLIRCAQLRRTVTYKEISNRIGQHWRAAPHFLGYIRDFICVPRGLPLINALVVNAETHLPGDSWLPEGVHKLTPGEKKRKFDEFRDDVFTYDGWEELLEDLGLPRVSATFDELDEEGKEYTEFSNRRSGIGESEPHKSLKQYIYDNPTRLGIPEDAGKTLEYTFVSGDKCDVVFETNDEAHVVEVKNGHRGELVKGIYQAIKYRALMIAEKGHGDDYPVGAYLVAYEIPEDIEAFAALFQVQCVVIDRPQVLGSK